MRGSIVGRAQRSWTIRVDLGRDATGKRKQKTLTVRGSKQQAQSRLTAVLKSLEDGQFVEPSKVTVGQWLNEWLTVSTLRMRTSTVVRYKDHRQFDPAFASRSREASEAAA